MNGRAFEKITLDKDPDYYWTGRVLVDSYKSNKRLRQFVVTATVRPYKYKQNDTVARFDLTEEEQTVSLPNARKSVCPYITCSSDETKVVFNGNTFTLGSGAHKILDIRLTEGENQVTISGTGNIVFAYQEGDL